MPVRYNMDMFVVGLLSWWYGEGWKRRFRDVLERLASTMDYFSIDLLLRTLFSPFRQISAGGVRGPLVVQIRAFFDNLLSRVIGATVRSIVIVIGVVTILLTVVVGMIMIVTWAIVPILPFIGLILASAGWTPWIQ